MVWYTMMEKLKESLPNGHIARQYGGTLNDTHLGGVWIFLTFGPSPVALQLSSVAQLCLTFCNPMDCSTPGLPVHQHLPELTQTHVHWVGDAIQPSHLLSSPSPSTLNLFQHQGLFKWVSSSHPGAKVLEFQRQHQSFQWIFRSNFLKNGLVGSPCSPSVSQESSSTPKMTEWSLFISKAIHSISQYSKSMPWPVMLKKLKLNGSLKTYKTF